MCWLFLYIVFDIIIILKIRLYFFNFTAPYFASFSRLLHFYSKRYISLNNSKCIYNYDIQICIIIIIICCRSQSTTFLNYFVANRFKCRCFTDGLFYCNLTATVYWQLLIDLYIWSVSFLLFFHAAWYPTRFGTLVKSTFDCSATRIAVTDATPYSLHTCVRVSKWMRLFCLNISQHNSVYRSKMRSIFPFVLCNVFFLLRSWRALFSSLLSFFISKSSSPIHRHPVPPLVAAVGVPGSRPLFPQWSHHVYPQFLPGGHPAHRHAHAHAHCKLDCAQHVNNSAHAHARLANYHRTHAGNDLRGDSTRSHRTSWSVAVASSRTLGDKRDSTRTVIFRAMSSVYVRVSWFSVGDDTIIYSAWYSLPTMVLDYVTITAAIDWNF